MSGKERDFKREMLAEIESNSMYRSALESATEADRAAAKHAVESFIGRFADDFIVPLMKSADSPALKKALIDKLCGVAEAPMQQAKKPDEPNKKDGS